MNTIEAAKAAIIGQHLSDSYERMIELVHAGFSPEEAILKMELGVRNAPSMDANSKLAKPGSPGRSTISATPARARWGRRH
jgi:hypothetical protein